MNEQRPPLYQLIEVKLGEDLARYVRARRPWWSWRQLAAEITRATGHSVNHETLRLWCSADQTPPPIPVPTRTGATR